MEYNASIGYFVEPETPTASYFPEEPVSSMSLGLHRDGSLALKLSRACQMLGRLDGMLSALPDKQVLTDSLIRIEALASVRLEGKLSSVAQLVHFESNPNGACDHHTLVALHLVKAIQHSLQLLATAQPLHASNLRGLYEIAYYGQLDEEYVAAEVRRANMARSGVVGYLPPALVQKNEAFLQLEAFVHAETKHPIALIHAARQCADFFDVHTLFEDDGRMQRLLVPVLLAHAGTLGVPLLPLSPYFCKYRDQSRRLLKAARAEGDWEPWTEFFLDAVAYAAESSIILMNRILDRFQQDDETLRVAGMSKGVSPMVLRALRLVPYVSPSRLASLTGQGLTAVSGVLDNLKKLGIVDEQPPRPGRMVCYLPYLQLLEEGATAV